MISKITDLTEYLPFMKSFTGDPDFSDPHITMMTEAGESLSKLLKDEYHQGFLVTDGAEQRGVFVLLIEPDEKYAEMIAALTRDAGAIEEMLAYIERTLAGYQCDFVFNPNNYLLRRALTVRNVEFDKEMQRMVFTHTAPACGTENVQLLSPEYAVQYVRMHNTDMYWTAERVMAAPERFRTYIALDGGTVTGYLDVTHCFDENEPYDLLVKSEYRRRGYGRQLLAAALAGNGQKDMMLFVETDNVPAIRLYESMGFAAKKNTNTLTAFWAVPHDAA